MNVRIQHGWYSGAFDARGDLAAEAPLTLAWSRRARELLHTNGVENVEIAGSPFVLFRHSRAIGKDEAAAGTVAFPQHSTRSLIEKYDEEEYCRQLRALDEEFQPVTVCLHYVDYAERRQVFLDQGFSVVTAGHSRQPDNGFVRNFYRILSNSKYATSNDTGSFAFYAVEMEIPFFVHGPPSLRVFRKDIEASQDKGEMHYYVRELFRGPATDISEEKRLLVREELGLDDALTPGELNRVLRKNFLRDIPRYPGRFLRTMGKT